MLSTFLQEEIERTISSIVSTQHDDSVLDGHQGDEGPNNQGGGTNYILLARIVCEDVGKGVEGTCSKITIYNPNTLKGQQVQEPSTMLVLQVSQPGT